MAKLTVIIVDDEPMACRRIANLLGAYPQFRILEICHDGIAGQEAIESLSPDVVFLDIEMPGRTGVELVQQLPEKNRPVIVFITAYNKYAIEAFNFFALDYLLKPFTEERFAETIRRISERKKKEMMTGLEHQLNAFLDFMQGDAPADTATSDRIQVALGNRIYFIKIAEIQHVVASGNYVNIQTESAVHVLRETLSSFEKKVINHGFIRIHKSYLINPEFLQEVNKKRNGTYTIRMSDDTVFSLSKTYKDDFFSKMK